MKLNIAHQWGDNFGVSAASTSFRNAGIFFQEPTLANGLNSNGVFVGHSYTGSPADQYTSNYHTVNTTQHEVGIGGSFINAVNSRKGLFFQEFIFVDPVPSTTFDWYGSFTDHCFELSYSRFCGAGSY